MFLTYTLQSPTKTAKAAMADEKAPASPEYDPFNSVPDNVLQDGLAKAGGYPTPSETPLWDQMKRRRLEAGGWHLQVHQL